MISRLKQYFGDMLVYKDPEQSRFFASLSLPSFMRDWLVMKFSDENGIIDKEEVSTYIKRVIPRKEQWEQYKYTMTHQYQLVKFLAKVKAEIDIGTRKAFFYLPDFGFPKRKVKQL